VVNCLYVNIKTGNYWIIDWRRRRFHLGPCSWAPGTPPWT
jgi:hypothetical protein